MGEEKEGKNTFSFFFRPKRVLERKIEDFLSNNLLS